MLAALLLNLGAAPAPPAVVTTTNFGAPVWWRRPWCDEDEEELECLVVEEKVLEKRIALRFPDMSPRYDRGPKQEARLRKIIEKLEEIQQRIKELKRKKEEDELIQDFLVLFADDC